MTTDISGGRGRFDLNRRAFAATIACETSDATAAPSEPSAREPFPDAVPDTGTAA
jgi:hypothetical protein